MPTADYNLADQPGAAYRSEHNNINSAVHSNNSNATAPSTIVPWSWWGDATNDVLKMRNTSDTAWTQVIDPDGDLWSIDIATDDFYVGSSNVATPALVFRNSTASSEHRLERSGSALNWKYNGTTQLIIDNGIFTVQNGTSGATANGGADNFVIDHNESFGGMSILSTDANHSRIFFGSPSITGGSILDWSHDDDLFIVGSNKTGATLELRGDNYKTNLSLSGGTGSELSTFVRDVTLTNGDLLISSGTAKIINGSSGGSAISSASELVIEHSGSFGGMSILGPNGTNNRFALGFPSNNLAAYFQVDELTNTFVIGTNDSLGNLSFKSASSAVGLTIDSSSNVDVPNGAFSVQSDQDGTHVIGRAKIGSIGTDEAVFGHFDGFGATTYTLKSVAGGYTRVNSAAGFGVGLYIADAAKLTVNSSGDVLIAFGSEFFPNLPVTAGAAGSLWNDSGTVKVA